MRHEKVGRNLHPLFVAFSKLEDPHACNISKNAVFFIMQPKPLFKRLCPWVGLYVYGKCEIMDETKSAEIMISEHFGPCPATLQS